jgi:hypothetical protein
MSSIVDFSKPHDTCDYYHYSRYINGKPTFESYERSTKSIVYQGPVSYHERKDPDAFRHNKLRKCATFKTLMKNEKELEYLQKEYEGNVLRKSTV